MKSNIWILFSVIVLIGCENRIDRSKLVGKYHFKTRLDDNITLFRDGQYEHVYLLDSGKIYKSTGRWVYNGVDISFDDFVFHPYDGESGGHGTWISDVFIRDGVICLNQNSDSDLYYEKE